MGKNEIDVLLGVDIDRSVLEEISDCDSRLNDMRAFYEKQLKAKDDRISALNAELEALRRDNAGLQSDKKSLVRTNTYLLEQLETKK